MHTSQLLLGAIGSFAALSACAVTPGPNKHFRIDNIESVLSGDYSIDAQAMLYFNASDIFDQKVNKAPGPYPSDCLFFYTLNQADKSFGCGGNHYEVNLTDFKSTQDFVLTIVNRYGSVRTNRNYRATGQFHVTPQTFRGVGFCDDFDTSDEFAGPCYYRDSGSFNAPFVEFVNIPA